MNEKHVVIRDLDIFRKVGHATAHDEYIPLLVKDRSTTLKHKKKTSKLGSTFKIEFMKGPHDNPKVCAFVIVKGSLSDAEKLVPPTTISGASSNNNNNNNNETRASHAQSLCSRTEGVSVALLQIYHPRSHPCSYRLNSDSAPASVSPFNFTSSQHQLQLELQNQI